jgi:Ca-activated chloride channel family protein
VEGTVILAFDVSGSMAAEDLQPNRMEAAKEAALSFVQRQPASVLVGVVAFSDTGFSVQPPTDDQSAVLAAISRLKPERGTSLGQGIIASLNAIAMDAGGAPIELTETPELPQGNYPSAIIVLLTDGENNEPPSPLEAARAAHDLGVRIFTVGIGSAAGAPLEVEGFTIHTRLDEAMLQQIARSTQGKYFNAETEADLREIYEDIRPELVVKPESMEVTSIFAGLGIVILLVGSALSLLWFGRVP